MSNSIATLPIADSWEAPELADVFDPFVFEHRMASYRHLIEATSDSDGQELMARLTGNYKRGNEREARSHPRNHRR